MSLAKAGLWKVRHTSHLPIPTAHRTYETALLSRSSSMSRSNRRAATSASGFLCPEQSQEFSLTTKDHHNYKDDALWMISKLLSHLEVEDKSKQAETMLKGWPGINLITSALCCRSQIQECQPAAGAATWLSIIHPAQARLFLTDSLPSLEFLHSAK